MYAGASAAVSNDKGSSGGGQKDRLGSHAVAGKQQRYTQLLNRAMQDDSGRQVGYHPAPPALWARDLGWQLRA